MSWWVLVRETVRFAFLLFEGLIANVFNKGAGLIREQAQHEEKIGYGLLPS